MAAFTTETICTPTLLLDEPQARQNLRRMAARAREEGVRFRPHFKTHQSVEIGAWFREEGVNAITVSSLEMAEYFAVAGWRDITVAFPVNLREMRRIQSLAAQVHLGLLVEDAAVVDALEARLFSPVDIWIKIDCGAGRTGLPWDQPAQAAQLARRVLAGHNLRLRGLLTHAGQTYAARSVPEIASLYLESVARVNRARREMETLGVADLEISVGDTPGCSAAPALGRVDEIRPGNFLFYDAQQWLTQSCQVSDIAVAVACPVVAVHPEREEAVVYGGAIHLSKDVMVEGDQRSYGLVCFPPSTVEKKWSAPIEGARVVRLSQEHGILHIPAPVIEQIAPGDLLCVLPAHSCLTVTAMRRYLTLDGRWIDTLNCAAPEA